MKIKKTIIVLIIWLVLQLCGGIPYTIGTLFNKENAIQLLVYGLLASQIAEILIFWLLKYFKPKEMVSPAPGWDVFLLSLPLGICIMYGIDLLATTVDAPDMLADLMPELCSSYWGILSIAVVGPIAEEVMMRRIILTEMKEATHSKWGGILISAAIFAIIHLNPAQILFAFPAGILLGWLYCRTGSLLVPICVHILNNSLAVLLVRLGTEDSITSLSDPRAIMELVVCAVVAVPLIIWMNRHYRRQEQTSIQD